MAKSFFSKKEGKVGLVVLGGMAVAIAVYFNPILATMRNMLFSLDGSIKLFAIFGVVAFIISDKRARNLITYGFKWLMRKITGLFTELDPMKILRKYVEDLEKNHRDLSENISKLNTQIVKIKDIIKQNNKEIEKSTRLISEAERQGRKEVKDVNYNQIGRLKKLNDKYALMVGRMDDLKNLLVKMHAYSSYKINDSKNEIRMREQEYSAISTGYSAMESAKNILSGNFQQNEMYEDATEAITNELHTKIADMDNFMKISQPIFDDLDIQATMNKLEGEKTYNLMMTEGKSILEKIYNETEKQSYLPGNNQNNQNN